MYSHFILSALSVIGAFTPTAHAELTGLDASAAAENHIEERSVSPYSNSDWLGWGGNVYNNRWASTGAKIHVSNVGDFQPTCLKEFNGGVSASPLVVSGVSYFPTWNGLFVALDYSSCKVLWQTNITSIILNFKPLLNNTDSTTSAGISPISRTTPVIDGETLFLGTSTNALLLAIDKRNGKLIDSIQINDHPLAIVTMSPTVWRGIIFVGASSAEESAADVIAGYVCCSFIGNMRGLVFEKRRFRLLWNQNMIPAGSNFSGAAIWGSQPSIDPVRKQVFIATGNVYSVPASYTACQNRTANQTSSSTSPTSPADATDPCAPRNLYQEAVLAFDTATGRINWVRQLNPLDAWNVACLGVANRNPGACPPNPGPDVDFGMAPSFVPRSNQTPSQQDTIIIGQKNGNLYALSAAEGKIFWSVATSPTGLIGGLIWGLAVDASAVYYTAVNYLRVPWQFQDGTNLSNSAWGSASLSTGKILWETAVPRNETTLVMPTVANDVVLTGTAGLGAEGYAGPLGDSSLVVLDKRTGAIIRETMVGRLFQGGIAVVREYVLFGTGYNSFPNGTFNVWKLGK
ncbi:MAG: hypothetical protein LQ346_008524 [Caloplaca aetnensis]|nr:MAG: hypothetical protein LQ346_008524 [Caloplaca aetnensis]